MYKLLVVCWWCLFDLLFFDFGLCFRLCFLRNYPLCPIVDSPLSNRAMEKFKWFLESRNTEKTVHKQQQDTMSRKTKNDHDDDDEFMISQRDKRQSQLKNTSGSQDEEMYTKSFFQPNFSPCKLFLSFSHLFSSKPTKLTEQQIIQWSKWHSAHIDHHWQPLGIYGEGSLAQKWLFYHDGRDFDSGQGPKSGFHLAWRWLVPWE